MVTSRRLKKKKKHDWEKEEKSFGGLAMFCFLQIMAAWVLIFQQYVKLTFMYYVLHRFIIFYNKKREICGLLF